MFCNTLQLDVVALWASPHAQCSSLGCSDCFLEASRPCRMWTCFSVFTAGNSDPHEKLFLPCASSISLDCHCRVPLLLGHSQANGGNSHKL